MRSVELDTRCDLLVRFVINKYDDIIEAYLVIEAKEHGQRCAIAKKAK